jgi:catechol 2,3-dioxygenase-like lactoylglutathione lyase family enzyme
LAAVSGIGIRTRRVNHIGITVADMDRSIHFYQGLLGFDLVFTSTVAGRADVESVVGLPGVRAQVAYLDAADTRLELWRYETPDGRSERADQRPSDRGIRHVALEVDDVWTAHRLLAEAGYATTTTPTDLGPHRTFYVRGPDDEILEILEDLGSDAATMRALQASREGS